MTTFINITTQLASVAEQLRQSTVQVQTRSSGSGSGVIWTSDGLIITNAHVATSNTVTVEWNGQVFDAVRTHFDPQRDLAALKITALDLPTVTIRDTKALRVGELVLAVGNPFSDKGTVTTGIIHTNHPRAIMADIQLFPGNSGGPLADCLGRVIGINTMIADGLAVAIPSEAVESFLRSRRRQNLGVTVQPVVVETPYSENKRTLGFLVLSVNSGSAAETAGVLIGDVLVGVSGQLFKEPLDLNNYLNLTDRNDVLPLQVLRGGQQIVCHVVLPTGKTVAGAV
ncbi:MAG: trypsin-like peptidase domain-containing protein [Rhizonema sp. PD37]|nr:trypsin-like peptidase domain-containing protein [Rhizonema sp. PD37]